LLETGYVNDVLARKALTKAATPEASDARERRRAAIAEERDRRVRERPGDPPTPAGDDGAEVF